MTFRCFARLVLVVVCVLGSVARAEGVLRGEAPDWAVFLPLPEKVTRQPGDQGGVHNVMVDVQVVLEGGEEVYFQRFVRAAVTRAGVEGAASFQLDFDPGSETVTLVALRRWRGGQALDLADRVRPEVIRRETGLEVGILDGSLTAVYQVPDVKVGDLVEFAWVTRRRPYIADLPLAFSMPLQTDLPMDLVHFGFHWPAGRALHADPVPDLAGLTATEGPGWQGARLLEWTLRGDQGVELEEMTAMEADPYATVRLSEAADWGPVVAALAPHYRADYPLPPDWQARLTEIAKAHPAPEDQALAVLRLVQDDIRYVSLSMGAGGYLARKPAEVVETGYGDCKDKALLTRQSLAFLGIASDVALTDLDEGRGLPLQPRALWVFDHAILRISLGGKTWWVDPTQSLQGGSLATQAVPEVAFALPLTGPGQKVLEPVPYDPKTQAWVEVDESFEVNDLGMFLVVQTRYGGRKGDDERASLATASEEDAQTELLSWYLDTFDGMEPVGKLLVTDDREAGVVTKLAMARMTAAAVEASGVLSDMRFETGELFGDLTLPLPAPRRWALGLGGPLSLRQTTRVAVQDQTLNPPEGFSLYSRAFDYSFSSYQDHGDLVLDWSYLRHPGPIPADQVEALAPQIRKLRDSTTYSWDLRE
ncbi:DUF3857 domain-containing transglutaminase family protein [Stagnihabitans tardus]|uniref:DUF3857 domain-containing protein n=1 Tax=Stagnihabitans tardus TaxID=2699202 RepID=A0AAE4Y6B6_9RHOB|nr:DUF3857 domain-containing transglutaminase family protein [Stagnihabitans tardus]NBZ86656.1 DUF3857 domain-containing protein [Stagnihabitans tardus]